MRVLTILLFCICLKAQAFTEFYCIKGTGTNVNAGSTTDANPTFSASSGNWTNATATFFLANCNPVTGGVTNGAWASICTNLTTTNAWFIGLVTNASDSSDTIQLSQVAVMGTNPADRVGDVFIRVGGCWAGPNTNTMANGGGFPFAFITQTATNTPTQPPRCNIKGGTVYGISNAITHALVGLPNRFQGYTTTPGDGGKCIIDGGTTLTGYILLTGSGSGLELVDIEFSNNGGSGSADLVALTAGSGGKGFVWRCVFHGARGTGLYTSSSGCYVLESECYSNNLSSTAGLGGFRSDVFGVTYKRCKSHDSLGSVTRHGFVTSAGASSSGSFHDCIAWNNGGNGMFLNGGATQIIEGCSLYNNVLSGIDIGPAAASEVIIENSSFIKNTINGINSTGGTLRGGQVMNCVMGTGTQTNGSGSFSANSSVLQTNNIILMSANTTPWVAPDSGDFRINSSEVKALGRGVYTYFSTNSPTIAYPDIGAAQSATTNTTTRAFGFSQ